MITLFLFHYVLHRRIYSHASIAGVLALGTIGRLSGILKDGEPRPEGLPITGSVAHK